jgi:predicted amidohydrolase
MNTDSRCISVRVKQFPVDLDIRANLHTILTTLERAQSGELTVFPEGALSGYAEDPDFLSDVDTVLLAECRHTLGHAVARTQVHAIIGSCVFEAGKWYNAALYYGPNQETFVYRKVNLAIHERGPFSAGSQLPVLDISIQGQTAKLGIQLCREIRFPEQWQYLARAGAEVFVYLTNAVGDKTIAPVWRSHLVSRAAENQRFVLCANNAHPEQKCPSMIVAPSGQVLWEALSAEPELARCELDLAQVSNWYLSQSREDLLK